ncbi:MAG: hypothetical protein HKP55_00225 [Gammaproteobacteria bacterium]|nr:hypothetical protein [Gammaproteobacteria bacterium]NNJ90070.1 hypothetical protein [Gammaproteobacteria bacterium]
MQRLHPSSKHRSRYGIEWRILKQIPAAFIISGVVIYLTNQLAHWLLVAETASMQLKQTEFIDIITISVLITIWTAIFTVAIGAFAVYIMKGPVYTADSLELMDSEYPLETKRDDKHSNS